MTYIAILVGAVSSMALGFLWYGPIFGTLWKSAAGITPEIEVAMKASVLRNYITNFVGNLVTGFIIYTLLRMLGIGSVLGALELILLVWVGFVLPLELSGTLWSKNPSWNLFYIHNTHTLISYFIIGISIVLIGL
jgi:hypothetical protein